MITCFYQMWIFPIWNKYKKKEKQIWLNNLLLIPTVGINAKTLMLEDFLKEMEKLQMPRKWSGR